jgi:hypothetical protein
MLTERTKKKTRKMTRTGKVRRSLVCLAAVLVLCAAGKKEKKTGVTVSPAILAGTVFGGVGFAQRGAEVVVKRTEATPSGKENWKAISDARGEFFMRLPPGPAKYTVSVRARGWMPQEKQVSFEADERLETNFLLEPAAGGGK